MRRQRGRGYILVSLILAFLWCGSAVLAEDRKPASPTPKDKCPVCGMFVAKYPDFFAQIIFKDGTAFFFDGTKDMFKFYFNLQRYSPKKKVEDIDALFVTDYYSLLPIDGFTALYVIGSDVNGPMGRELIPFGKNQEALEFKRDHKGKDILKFHDITSSVVKGLD